MTAAALFCMTGAAGAQMQRPSAWLVQAGVSRLSMADDADVSLAGTAIAGAGVRSKAQVVPTINVTRFVSPALGVSLATGLPPTIRYKGTGVLADAGVLLDVKYAAPAVTLVWSPRRERTVAPYLGGGVTYVHVLSTRDGALQRTHVDDDVGPVFQAGMSVFPRARLGAFIDLKKALVRTTSYGLVGGLPTCTRMRMDPTVVQVGLSLRL